MFVFNGISLSVQNMEMQNELKHWETMTRDNKGQIWQEGRKGLKGPKLRGGSKSLRRATSPLKAPLLTLHQELLMLLNGTIFVGSFMIWAGSAPHHTPSDTINDSYSMPQNWRKSWRPYHARTPCGQLQRQRETAKRLFRHITPSQLCILSVNNSLIRYETCNTTMTNINFSDTFFVSFVFWWVCPGFTFNL